MAHTLMRGAAVLLSVSVVATGTIQPAAAAGQTPAPTPTAVTDPSAPIAPYVFTDTTLVITGPQPVFADPTPQATSTDSDVLFHPPLLNPTGVSPLPNLESAAITATIKDHGLAPGDALAVRTWGRAEAQSALWALLVQAIKTEPSARTADQQNAVAWFSAIVQQPAIENAAAAGLEYVKWAGLEPENYLNLLATNPSQSQLSAFLSTSVNTYGSKSNVSSIYGACGLSGKNLCEILDASYQGYTTGYCVYESPAPYEWAYTGRDDQTCYVPCTNVLGCTPPTPSYDQFVLWGAAVRSRVRSRLTPDNFTNDDFAQALRSIAGTLGFGAAAIGGSVAFSALSSGLAPVLAGSATAAFPFASAPIGVATAESAALGAEVGGVVAASSVGAVTAKPSGSRDRDTGDRAQSLREIVVREVVGSQSAAHGPAATTPSSASGAPSPSTTRRLRK
ncbi:MAG TPA: hypothetical protein VGL99_06870 [Chloroflexota bacterium]